MKGEINREREDDEAIKYHKQISIARIHQFGPNARSWKIIPEKLQFKI